MQCEIFMQRRRVKNVCTFGHARFQCAVSRERARLEMSYACELHFYFSYLRGVTENIFLLVAWCSQGQETGTKNICI
jgi:hypothetical protein